MHGGVKFYRGAARAARAYIERDRSRADDYYLGEGTGVAERLTATPTGVEHAGSMNGETYERDFLMSLLAGEPHPASAAYLDTVHSGATIRSGEAARLR